MQETRRHILEILKIRGQATVDEIVGDLCERRGKITAVTVRHHLSRLQQDNLVAEPHLQHRDTPGRPQYLYELGDEAQRHFPNNYEALTITILEKLHARFQPQGVNVIFEGVADALVSKAQIPDVPIQERLNLAVNYLNSQGYNAHWEKTVEGFILHTSNCPYHHIAQTEDTLCQMDLHLISGLLDVIPRLRSRVTEGAASCSYLIPAESAHT